MPSPSKRSVILALLLALGVLSVTPASAELYYVHLKNGKTFETRYQPQEASWDSNQVLFLTEMGNWIAVSKDDLSDVEINSEVKGFGKVIDSTTIALGPAPNDAPVPGQEQQNPQAQLLQYLQNQQANQPDYSQPQFVNPGSLGREGGGLPVSYAVGSNAPPGQVTLNTPTLPGPTPIGGAAAAAAAAGGGTPPQQ